MFTEYLQERLCQLWPHEQYMPGHVSLMNITIQPLNNQHEKLCLTRGKLLALNTQQLTQNLSVQSDLKGVIFWQTSPFQSLYRNLRRSSLRAFLSSSFSIALGRKPSMTPSIPPPCSDSATISWRGLAVAQITWQTS